MTPPKPLFIVIEGLDGSGKSTIARGLAADLGALLLQTPDASLRDARLQVEAYLGEGSPALTLFYAMTVLAASERARSAIVAGQSVVLDRYWASTLAYARVVGREVDLAGIEPLLLPADLTVFLHVERAVRAARMRAWGPLSDHDRLSLDPAGEAALFAAYRDLARARTSGRWMVLSGKGAKPDTVLAAAQVGVRR